MGANANVSLIATMGICSDVTVFFQAVGKSEHLKKKGSLCFSHPLLFFSFIISYVKFLLKTDVTDVELTISIH